MDVAAAGEAVKCLMSHAAGWFSVHEPQYTRRVGSLLRRVPGGASADAKAALQAELQRLQDERRDLVARGPEHAVQDEARASASSSSSSSALAPAPSTPV